MLDKLLDGLGIGVVVLLDHRVGREALGLLLVPCWSSTTRPGMPTTVAPAATSFTTTEFAPMRAPSPTVKPPSTFAPAPTITPAPKVGWRLVPG